MIEMGINNSHNGEVTLSFDHLEGEIWKNIEGYEGIYEISNYGRIKNVKRGSLVQHCLNKVGYAVVKLPKEGKRVHHKLHRLIANAFLPNPNNYPVINHKDEVKANNNLSNLEWCTHQYNNTYNQIHYRRNKSHRTSVIKMSIDGVFIESYNSVNEAGASNNIHPSSISNCLRGRDKTAAGFRWKYKK